MKRQVALASDLSLAAPTSKAEVATCVTAVDVIFRLVGETDEILGNYDGRNGDKDVCSDFEAQTITLFGHELHFHRT